MGDTVEIRLLGELRILRNGAELELPQSRKTRALLAALVLKGTPQRRDALSELLWDRSDDPRGSLRWSLSKLRPLLNEPGIERLVAHRDTVAFDAHGATIDIAEIERCCAGGLSRLERRELERLAALFAGPLLGGLELPNSPEFETWRLGERERARRLQLAVLRALIERTAADEAAHAELLRRLIEIEPQDVAAHVQLVRQLRAAGRRAEAATQLDASARLLAETGGPSRSELEAMAATGQRFQGVRVVETFNDSDPLKTAESGEIRAQPASAVRFCRARDGVRLAYAIDGAGPPLVKTANWLNHLEFDWASPIWRHLFRALTESWSLLRYDARGNGLSDWDADELSFEAFVDDFGTIVDTAGLGRFPIFAVSQGCAIAIEYAVRYPERVSKLVLFGGFARGWRASGSEQLTRHGEALMTVTRIGWGSDNPAFRQLFTTLFMPDASPEQLRSFNELQRATTSPGNAARILSALGDFDVRHRLAEVRTPTLVAHCRGDSFIPYQLGREIAVGIPNARFLSLEGNNHLLLDNSPALPILLGEMRRFLAD